MRISRTLIPLAVLLTLGAGIACKKPAPAPEPEAPKVVEVKPPVVVDDGEAKRKAAEEEARRKAAEEEARRKAEAAAAALAAYRRAAEAALKDINFDFDKSDIREMDKAKLQAISDFMKNYPQAKVQIEGHTDERGTVEYNLALGERRAHATQSYLVSLGTSEAKLSSISYGKERPKVQGKDEETWLINRRCEFKLQ
jgi:peptidoglycan-associated lipoprotein